MLAEPTSIQREAFDLIGAPIPLTLKYTEQNPASQPSTRSSPGFCPKPAVTSA